MIKHKSSVLKAPAILAVGAGFGLLTAYFLDPISGKTRRAQIRDRGRRFGRGALESATKRARGLGLRWRGRLIEFKRELAPEVEVDDFTLTQRVRSQLGHRIHPPRTLRIEARRGVVTLSGPILSDDLDKLITCVERVPGVRGVLDRMSVSAEGASHDTRH